MKALLSILSCLLMSLTAWAEQGDLPIRTSGFYLGAGIGSGDAEIKTDLGTVSGTDTAFRIAGGYRWWDTFMPWDIDLGLEVAYLQLGERDNTLAIGDLWKLENTGVTAALVGFVPITPHFELIGKGGLIFSDTKLSNQTINIPSASDSSSDMLIGIGLAYRTAGKWSAALEYENYGMLNGASLASVAIYYQFK